MHLLLYLTASLVGDLRRTCQPTSHGRFEYHVERSFSSISYFSVSSLLFSPRFSRSSSVWSLSSPPPSSSLPGGPVHKAGTVSQAAGHPVTRRGPFEVFENANSRDRTPNEISRCVQPRAVSLFPLSSLTPHCDDASHARIRVKVENDYELRGILPQARNYSLLARTVYSYISFSLGRRTSCFYEDYLPLRPNHTYSIRIWLLYLLLETQNFKRFLPVSTNID